jgi:maltooligosyltrehalose synthase
MGSKTRMPIGEAWGDAALLLLHLAGERFENVFTGEQLEVGADGRLRLRLVFGEFPVAMLVRVG